MSNGRCASVRAAVMICLLNCATRAGRANHASNSGKIIRSSQAWVINKLRIWPSIRAENRLKSFHGTTHLARYLNRHLQHLMAGATNVRIRFWRRGSARSRTQGQTRKARPALPRHRRRHCRTRDQPLRLPIFVRSGLSLSRSDRDWRRCR